jgi:hypothetical protein
MEPGTLKKEKEAVDENENEGCSIHLEAKFGFYRYVIMQPEALVVAVYF